jgi:hypothetical protein
MSTNIFYLVHFDVWSSSPLNSIGGSCYFVVFIVFIDFSNWIFLMNSHFELLNIYCNFAKMIKTQFSKHIKVFRSDNALENTHHAFQNIMFTN